MLKIPAHNNVVSLLGVCLAPLALVVEFAEQGALDAMIYDAAAPRRFDAPEQRALALGIARGVAFLHTHKIVHRDLAARNIVNSLFCFEMNCGVCVCVFICCKYTITDYQSKR